MKSLKSIVWYANRLRAMKPAEIGHRVAEKWRQATEAGFLAGLKDFSVGLPSHSPRLPDRSEAPAELRHQLAEDAEKLKRGQWQIFGWRTVEVGAPPCWHRDPVCGVVIDPAVPAKKLNHRDLPDGADARTIWEINRWAEVTRLGMHGWINQDLDALRTAQLWLEDWCERNPPGTGINWTSPLEVALRLINFTWFDALVNAAIDNLAQGPLPAIIRSSQAELIQKIAVSHVAWVWRYRSAGSSANNHLLGELVALIVSVSRWPVLAELSCSADKAWESLSQEILHQFAEDGGSKEQALHYHALAFELSWLAARTVGCKAGDVYDRLQAAAVWLKSLAHAEDPWDFGDSDDAQVLPLTLHREDAMSEWLGWLEGKPETLAFWLGEPPSGRPDKCAESGWQIFPDTGMAVIREDGWMARLDASPLGFGSLAAHGHGDALHLSIWDGSQAVIIDPGTGGYYGHQEFRAELAAWEAHNGPLPPNGYQTPRRSGTFLWLQHHARPGLSAKSPAVTADFKHEGQHFKRSVIVQLSEVRIEDESSGQTPFIIHLCLAPGCEVKLELDRSQKIPLQLGTSAWSLSLLGDTKTTLLEKRVSPCYGKIKMTRVLRIEVASGKLAWTLKRHGNRPQVDAQG